MSLTTKNQMHIVLQTIKKLLSLKADKSELPVIPDAVELATETGLINPMVADDGSIYTDENGVLYSL